MNTCERLRTIQNDPVRATDDPSRVTERFRTIQNDLELIRMIQAGLLPPSHSWIPGFRRLTRDSVFQPIFS